MCIKLICNTIIKREEAPENDTCTKRFLFISIGRYIVFPFEYKSKRIMSSLHVLMRGIETIDVALRVI